MWIIAQFNLIFLLQEDELKSTVTRALYSRYQRFEYRSKKLPWQCLEAYL